LKGLEVVEGERKEVVEGGEGKLDANEGRVEEVLYNLRAIDVKAGVCRRSGANGQNCDTVTRARSSE
jgi:hypothetical protein